MKQDLILVYSHKLTERVRYSFELLLSNLLGISLEFTNDREHFEASQHPKLNYSEDAFGDEMFFRAQGLLHQRGIRDQQINIEPFEDTIGFFFLPGPSALPFDVFAAAFYLVSRYEEYLPFVPDDHNRFPASESIAFQQGFLKDPVVNIWAMKLKKVLSTAFPAIVWPIRQYQFTPTYDIDIAWAYLHKGLIRTVGGYGKSLLHARFRDIYSRTKTMLGIGLDPYFTFDYMRGLQDKYDLEPIYFFILGNFGRYDKNTPHTFTKFRALIKGVDDHARVGIHPSYGSNEKPEQVAIEKKRIESILHRSITKSRQHYLMMRFPDTYQNLVSVDISEDYTMGYSTTMGFRAGICSPFPFYNLSLEYKTPLTLYPFAVMDASLKYYMKMSPDEAADATKAIIDSVKNVNGHLITLWHNNSFSEYAEWKGWRKAYEEIIQYALP